MNKKLPLPFQIRFVRVPTRWQLIPRSTLAQDSTLADGYAWLPLGAAASLSLKEPISAVLIGKIRANEAIREVDGWAIRERFFRLPHDDEALLEFLTDVGLWRSGNASDNCKYDELYLVADRVAYEPKSMTPTPEEIWAFREELKQALVLKTYFIEKYAQPVRLEKNYNTGRDYGRVSNPYIYNEFPIRFELSGRVPSAVITTISCFELLLTTAYIDLIQGYRFKFCKRKDCGLPFAVTSGHKRSFCSQYCGHLVSLRRKRKDERRASKKENQRGKKR